MRIFFTLVLFFLLTIASNVQAQSATGYISAGYGVSVGSYSGLSEFLQEYNRLRKWLVKKMPEPTELDGFCAGFGYAGENVLLDLQWTGRHKTYHASGTQSLNNIYGYRDFKYRMNTFNSGVGVGGGNEAIKLYLGASLDIGFSNSFTRSWEEGDDVPKFTNTDNNKISLASTFFLDFRIGKKVALGIKPFYQLHFFKHDFNQENNDINEINAYYSDDEKYSSTPSNFGVEAKVFINFE